MKILTTIAAGLFSILIINSFKHISADQQGVVYRFGQFNRILTPGLQFLWPQPIEKITIVSVALIRSARGSWCCLRTSISEEGAGKSPVAFMAEWSVKNSREFLELGSSANKAVIEITKSEIEAKLSKVGTTLAFFDQHKALQRSIGKQVHKRLDQSKTGISLFRIHLRVAK